MDKIDLKKRFKKLYSAPTREIAEIHVPTRTFVKVDGKGDPNVAESYRTAVTWLYGVSYAMKFAAQSLTTSCRRWRRSGGPTIPAASFGTRRKAGAGPS
jgi:hypothetical protein